MRSRSRPARLSSPGSSMPSASWACRACAAAGSMRSTLVQATWPPSRVCGEPAPSRYAVVTVIWSLLTSMTADVLPGYRSPMTLRSAESRPWASRSAWSRRAACSRVAKSRRMSAVTAPARSGVCNGQPHSTQVASGAAAPAGRPQTGHRASPDIGHVLCGENVQFRAGRPPGPRSARPAGAASRRAARARSGRCRSPRRRGPGGSRTTAAPRPAAPGSSVNPSLAGHAGKDRDELGAGVVGELNVLGEAGGESRVGLEEAVHFARVARGDDAQPAAPVLHLRDERVDGLVRRSRCRSRTGTGCRPRR